MADGHKTALELALAEARAVEAAEGPEQGDLFGDGERVEGREVERRGPGRPPGARNARTDQLAKWYIGQNGDPLSIGTKISALPILARGVLEGLAERLGCSRHDAAKFWASIYSATMPYLHQRLAQLEVKQPGSLGSGEPVTWAFSDDGEIVDVRPEDPPNHAT
jgi:hypothetical protein